MTMMTGIITKAKAQIIYVQQPLNFSVPVSCEINNFVTSAIQLYHSYCDCN